MEPRLLLAAVGGIDLAPAGSTQVAGVIEAPGGAGNHAFTAPARGRVTVDLLAEGAGLDPCLEVYDARGRRVRANDDASAGTADSRVSLNVRPGSTYTVRALASGGTAGAYTLRVTSDPRDDCANGFHGARFLRTNPRRPARRGGRLDYVTDTDMLVFVPTLGGVMRAVLEAGSAEASLAVYDTDGRLLAAGAPEADGRAVLTFVAEAEAGYFLAVEGAEDAVGRYRVSLGLDMAWEMPDALVVDRTFDVTAWGAVGDGVHDDTAALQAAIDAAQDASIGGAVVLPSGRYRITDTLEVGAGGTEVAPEILGLGGARIVWDGPDDGSPMLRWDATGGGHKADLRGVVFDGAGRAAGLDLAGGFRYGNTLRHCAFVRTRGWAVDAATCWGANFRHLWFYGIEGGALRLDQHNGGEVAHVWVHRADRSSLGDEGLVDLASSNGGVYRDVLVSSSILGNGAAVRLRGCSHKVVEGVTGVWDRDETADGPLVALVGARTVAVENVTLKARGEARGPVVLLGDGAVRNRIGAVRGSRGQAGVGAAAGGSVEDNVVGRGRRLRFREADPAWLLADALEGARVFDVCNFGARSDGSGDSTAAIQLAIDAATMAGGPAVVVFPRGAYRVTRTLEVGGGGTTAGVSLVGPARATLIWAGDADGDPMLRWNTARDRRPHAISGLAFKTGRLANGIRLENGFGNGSIMHRVFIWKAPEYALEGANLTKAHFDRLEITDYGGTAARLADHRLGSFTSAFVRTGTATALPEDGAAVVLENPLGSVYRDLQIEANDLGDRTCLALVNANRTLVQGVRGESCYGTPQSDTFVHVRGGRTSILDTVTGECKSGGPLGKVLVRLSDGSSRHTLSNVRANHFEETVVRIEASARNDHALELVTANDRDLPLVIVDA